MSASSEFARRAPAALKTPFKIAARVLLVVLLALATLEVLLRTTGFIISAGQLNRVGNDGNCDRRVLCAGDSFVYGVGGEPFPAQLEKILNEKQSRLKFKVYNVGIPGNGTQQVLRGLPAQLRQYSPHYLILLAGTNNKGLYFTLPDRNAVASALAHLKVWRLWQLLSTPQAAEAGGAQPPAGPTGQPRLRPTEESSLQSAEHAWYSANVEDIMDQAYNNPASDRALRVYALQSEEQFLLLRKYVARDETENAALALEKLLSSAPLLPDDSTSPTAQLGLRMQKTVRFRAASEMGHLYNELDGNKAIAAFKKAVSLRPDYISGYYQIANIYRLAGDSRNFFKYIKLLLQKAPDFTPAYMELCWYYYLNREERLSVDYLEEALRREPLSADLITQAPYLFAELQKYLPELEERIPQLIHNPAYRQYKQLAEASKDRPLEDEIKAIKEQIRQDLLSSGRLAARHNARLLISSYPEQSLPPAEEAARELHTPYINFVPLFRQRFRDNKAFLAFDNNHCNTAGYRFMAEKFAQEILLAESGMQR